MILGFLMSGFSFACEIMQLHTKEVIRQLLVCFSNKKYSGQLIKIQEKNQGINLLYKLQILGLCFFHVPTKIVSVVSPLFL